jgi:hypothetical protein
MKVSPAFEASHYNSLIFGEQLIQGPVSLDGLRPIRKEFRFGKRLIHLLPLFASTFGGGHTQAHPWRWVCDSTPNNLDNIYYLLIIIFMGNASTLDKFFSRISAEGGVADELLLGIDAGSVLL